MLKKIFILLIVLINLNAQTNNEEKYQINAKNVDTKNDIVTASGDVVIFSKTYYITADKAIYDKANKTFELFDNVVILKNNLLQAQSNYAFVNMQDESMIQNPILMLDKATNLWINSKTSEKKNNKFNLDSSILSSCNCEDPAWSIKFSSGDYNTDDKWINTYNTRLYIKSMPVFYTPYFGFSADKTRRTGLLPATVGFSNSEGFLYAQPIYIAPQANYDIELIPQVRTDRGEGMYAYFRWADSQYSMLKLKSGIFTEHGDYYTENSLDNTKHFGWSVDYERSKLFSNDDDQDGLYLSANWLNDVEYYNVESQGYRQTYNKRIESKLNYFYKTSEYFGGIYMRHYLDTELASNDTTIQQLPQVQLHKFSQPVFLDKLLYSTDLKYTNYTRPLGLEAQQYDFSLPIYYGFSLFDDYLKVTFREELALTHIKYANGTRDYKDGTFMHNKHIISVGTDLLKPYEDYLHTLNFSTEFAVPNTARKSGDLYTMTNTSSELAPYPVTQDEKTLTFALNHSLYDRDNLTQIINHKIKQAIIYDQFDEGTLSDLENEVTFNYILGSISNRIKYSNQDNELIESSSDFAIGYDWFTFNSGYYMSKNTPHSGKEELESYTLGATARFSRDYAFSYALNYNVNDNLKSKESYILSIDDKCWTLSIQYANDLVAAASTTQDAIRQNVVYFNIELKPIGQIKQSYKVKGQ